MKPINIFALKVAACAALAAFLYGVMLMFLGGAIPYLVPAVLVASGAYLGLIDRTRIEHGQFLKRGIGCLFAAVAIWLGAPASEGGIIKWQDYHPALLDAARRGERPVMIEFMTQTCPYCRKMERDVFTRRRVARAAEPFLTLRADLSASTPENDATIQRFQIQAFPTVVFLGPDGQERANLRLVGYERAESFAQRLEQAR